MSLIFYLLPFYTIIALFVVQSFVQFQYKILNVTIAILSLFTLVAPIMYYPHVVPFHILTLVISSTVVAKHFKARGTAFWGILLIIAFTWQIGRYFSDIHYGVTYLTLEGILRVLFILAAAPLAFLMYRDNKSLIKILTPAVLSLVLFLMVYDAVFEDLYWMWLFLSINILSIPICLFALASLNPRAYLSVFGKGNLKSTIIITAGFFMAFVLAFLFLPTVLYYGGASQPTNDYSDSSYSAPASTPSPPPSDSVDTFVETATSRTHLNVAASSLADSMNPSGMYILNDSASAHVIKQMYDTLLVLDYDTATPIPALAVHWEMWDSQTIYMQLREDVIFHNGHQLTADDVIFSLERASTSMSSFEMIELVERTSDYEILIHLNAPFAPILRYLAHPAASVVPYGISEEELEAHPIGTGPFMFSRLDYDRLELVRFDRYWGDLPIIESMSIFHFPEPERRVRSIETGEMDISLDIPFSEAEYVQNSPYANLLGGMNWTTNFVGLNTNDDPFRVERARRAIAYGIDPKRIIDEVNMGMGTPATNHPIPFNMFGFADIWRYDYNPERAREIMEEVGSPEFSLLTNAGNRANIAQHISSALWEFGIRNTIDIRDFAEFLQLLNIGEFDMFVLSISSATGDADDILYPLFHTNGLNNYTGYSNKYVDELLEQAQFEMNDDFRLEIYYMVQEIILEEVPCVFINHNETLVAVSNDLWGFTINPAGHHSYSKVWFE